MAEITMPITMPSTIPNTMPNCYEFILPKILSQMRSRLGLGDPELRNYYDN